MDIVEASCRDAYKKAAGHELSGRTFDEMPKAQLRQKNVPLPLENILSFPNVVVGNPEP